MKFLLVVLVLTASQAQAAKTTIGSTNASRCYQESNHPSSDYGLRFCNAAIKDDDLLTKNLAATLTNRGIILAANGRFDEALVDHNEAMLLAPEMGKIYINRANVFHQLQALEDALTDYDKAVSLGNVPLDIAYYNRSLTLILLKRWDDARASLEKALEVNPDSTRVLRKLEQFNAPTEKPSAVVVSPDQIP